MRRLARDSAASIQLDLARGLAALAVMGGHVYGLFFLTYRDYGHLIWDQAVFYVWCFGHEAVMVFFVLSGFLVGSSVVKAMESGRWSWKDYASRRFTRLSIVLLPALAVGMLLDGFGVWQFGSGGVYGAGPKFHGVVPAPVEAMLSVPIFLGNAAFLQGLLVPTLGSNSPLWSLSVEFWYYVAFPLLWLGVRGREGWGRRLLCLVGVGLVLALLGRHHSARFLIWLMGVGVAMLPPAAWLGHWAVGWLSALGIGGVAAGAYFGLPPASLAGDALVGLSFSGWLLHTVNAKERTVGKGRRFVSTHLSKLSYSLYAVHLPVLVLLNAWLIGTGPLWTPSWETFPRLLGLMGLALAFGWVMWWLFESRTEALRRRLFRPTRAVVEVGPEPVATEERREVRFRKGSLWGFVALIFCVGGDPPILLFL